MPMRVPTYQPQVDRQVAPHTPQTPDAYGGIAANQTLQMGRGLDGLADGLDKIAEQQANTAAFNAEAQAKKDWIAFSADLQKNRQGVNAQGVTADVEKWWNENKSKYRTGTTGRAARMIESSMTRLQTAAMGQFKDFELAQGQQAADAATQANVSASVSAIAANPSTDNIALQRQGITAALQAHAASRGWAPEVLNDKLATAHSAATIAAFNTLLAQSPKAARDFWSANREQVRGENRDEIETRLKHALASTEAEDAVSEIWKTLGPKSDIDAVQMDVLGDAVRAKFKDQPEQLKAALGALKERAGEHNAAQSERAAQSTNEVMAIWNGTRSLAKVKASQAWATLPAQQQAKIEEHIESIQNVRLNRQVALGNLELQQEERRQRALKQRGFAAYLEYSRPEVLTGMSDAQVQALLPSLGNELTEHLVSKRRQLTSADATRTASIDKQDFDTIAQEMGLRPYEHNASEDHKAALGTLQYRMEQLIDAAQRQKKAPLDRQEKQALMRREVAQQVLVNPGMFNSNVNKPVISLTPDEVGKVVIPATERQAISNAMRLMFERTGRSDFAPSEENLRRFYLLQRSPAAALIPRAANGK